MPKINNYPLVSMDDALDVAQTVQLLGGSCPKEACADKLGKTLSGAFNSAISAAVKFGLLTNKKGVLTTTQLFRNISLAYTPEERNQFLKESFFNVDLFKQLYESYPVTTLKREILDKILVKEFDVDLRSGTQVAKHYLDSLKTAQLDAPRPTSPPKEGIISIQDIRKAQSAEPIPQPSITTLSPESAPAPLPSQSRAPEPTPIPYKISIDGPEFSLNMSVGSAQDFEILEAILQKIKSKVCN